MADIVGTASRPHLPDSLAELARIRERAARTDTLAHSLGVKILPRPATVFEYRGRFLCFVTEMRTIVELDKPAYVVLGRFLLGDTADEMDQALADAGLEAAPDEVLTRLKAFRDAGYFTPPPAHAAIHRDVDAVVEGLVRHQPMKMMLFMAQTCNLRCTYCYGIEGNYRDEGRLMAPEVARASVDYLFRDSPDRRHFYVYFFGGEPLLNLPVMRETVRYGRECAAAAGKTIEFGVTTNGTLLTEAACDFLTGEDFQITVSLDGTPTGHDVNRPTKGGGGSSQHVLRGLDRLRGRTLRPNQLKIRATMSHQNHDPIEIADYFSSLGIQKFGIGSTVARAGDPQPTTLADEDFEELEDRFEVALDRLIDRIEKGKRPPRYNPFYKGIRCLARGQSKPFIGCGVCRNDQGIGTDGRIYPCHRYVGLDNYVIGHVRTGLDRDKTRAVYRQFFEMWERHCSNCWARYSCSGSCAWQHSHDDGRLRDPIGSQCNSIRRSLQRAGWLSVELGQKNPALLAALSAADQGAAEIACSNPA